MYNVTIFTLEPGCEYRTEVEFIYEIEAAIKLINESRPELVVLIGDIAIRAGDFKALAARKIPEEVPKNE